MSDTRDELDELDQLGREILINSRNELCMRFHYLYAPLCAMPFQSGGTISIATDGESIFYNPAFLSERFTRSHMMINRAYLHLILHCMFRHLRKKRGKQALLWDIACDVVVESVLDSLKDPCLAGKYIPAKQAFYDECRRDMRVLTAEGIYRRLSRSNRTEYELSALNRLFHVDEHDLWDPDRQRAEKQDQDWKERAERVLTGIETVRAGQAVGGEAVSEQVKAAVRDDMDYHDFLLRFAAPREILSLDADAFDYGFYSYGLRLYGNLPLIEPVETREEKRIDDFIIAIDTSMSTSGETVKLFLACTYAVLRTSDIFTRKVNIRILQCDDQIRSDNIIHDLDELKNLMENFKLTGGSATDFRPAFDYVNQLRQAGEIANPRGLIYFTDGMGIYPERRPPYQTAFILAEEPPMSISMPPWAIRLILELPDLERTARKIRDADINIIPEKFLLFR